MVSGIKRPSCPPHLLLQCDEFRARLGLPEGPMTLEQVSVVLGVSRERVRQIEAAALRKLRTMADESDLAALRAEWKG